MWRGFTDNLATPVASRKRKSRIEKFQRAKLGPTDTGNRQLTYSLSEENQ
jgi:hypothetical protein